MDESHFPAIGPLDAPSADAIARHTAQQSGAAVRLPTLPVIPGAVLLTPGSADYDSTLPAFELRTTLRPALRALCETEAAVAAMVRWVATNRLEVALRCGGHSFEGLSQSTAVVIDLRRLNGVTIDSANATVTVGAGASLGDIYKALAPTGFALAGGSCPTVGIAGHVLGGGMGLLGRAFGLTCDNLLSLSLVDKDGAALTVDARSHPDLYWACRGGGGGSFGVATRFQFRLYKLAHVVTFSLAWVLPAASASDVFTAWQGWAPSTSHDITAIMKVAGRADGTIALSCFGQSTGSAASLLAALKNAFGAQLPPNQNLRTRTFFEAADHFAGQDWSYHSIFHKGKSDFVVGGLSRAGIEALFGQLVHAVPSNIVVICDPYGGAIADVPQAATAFLQRGRTSFCMQYYCQWANATQTHNRLAAMRAVYAAMRPFVSGFAYVNYCDGELADYANAYWGANLARLQQVKATYDPQNLFRHRQSIPLPSPATDAQAAGA